MHYSNQLKKLKKQTFIHKGPSKKSVEYLNKVEVLYKDGKRKVRCFCGNVINRSIVLHMRKDHPDIWYKWTLEFINLKNLGYSSRQIMKKFSAQGDVLLFTWNVIDKEIKKVIEHNESALILNRKDTISSWDPINFQQERTTIWSFRRRGNWAIHTNDYRGNWPPQVPRNLILKYTKPEEIVLDPFVGGGTTLIEAWLLRRKGVGLDISPLAYQTTFQKLKLMEVLDKASLRKHLESDLRPLIIRGDARNLVELCMNVGIGPETVDLICAHPPYLDSLQYTETIDEDLSHIHNVDTFCAEIRNIAGQLWNLLKPGKVCAILMGDVRKNKNIIPLGYRLMQEFIAVGFVLREIIIKTQTQDSSTEIYFNKKKGLDYLLAHEYLYIFMKPGIRE